VSEEPPRLLCFRDLNPNLLSLSVVVVVVVVVVFVVVVVVVVVFCCCCCCFGCCCWGLLTSRFPSRPV